MTSTTILDFPSISAARDWLSAEERRFKVSFLLRKRTQSRNGVTYYYYCNRHGSYTSSSVGRRNCSSKKVGVCEAKIVFHCHSILGKFTARYWQEHSHEIGLKNLKHVPLDPKHRKWALELIRSGLPILFVQERLQNKIFASFDESLDENSLTREALVDLQTLRNLKAMADREKYLLRPNDVDSTREWVRRLGDDVLFSKFRGESHDFLDTGVFALSIFSKFQRKMYANHHKLLCMDATHKITAYGFLLFSLVCMDDYGNGIPICFLITNSGLSECIEYWLHRFKAACAIEPKVIMTDNDDAELQAVGKVFPSAIKNLCWWHVLRAWRKNLVEKVKDKDIRESIWKQMLFFIERVT